LDSDLSPEPPLRIDSPRPRRLLCEQTRMRIHSSLLPLVLGLAALSTTLHAAAAGLPVRGLCLMAPSKKDLPAAIEFIRGPLRREKVNTLVLEFDYGFNFHSRPEFANDGALDKEGVRQLARACRDSRIELIPMLNCLGHQSWAAQTGRLLQIHPEFDETVGKFPGNSGIYCRSYCPLHPGLHAVLFDLIDELADACATRTVHVGMDEVFILADPDCPRCHGRDPAELFAGEVKILRDHLHRKGLKMWMWGDRFIDGRATHLGKWEASENGTARAIDLAPKDVVICDWHYDDSPGTPEFFVKKGFKVVECPWRKTNVAIQELARVDSIREQGGFFARRRALGVMQTSWNGFRPFLNDYNKALTPGNTGGNPPKDSEAGCFINLFKAVRAENK